MERHGNETGIPVSKKSAPDVKYLKYLTKSDTDTIRLGHRLGTLLWAGDVIALIGELGSGKTCFTKGLALGIGVGQDEIITSPSFAIVNEYQGDHLFYHMDLYRLTDPSDFATTGLEEYFNSEGVVVMEWADRWPEILPEWRIEIRFEIMDVRERELTFYGIHPRAVYLIESMKEVYKG